jgi:hypothetical protein
MVVEARFRGSDGEGFQLIAHGFHAVTPHRVEKTHFKNTRPL